MKIILPSVFFLLVLFIFPGCFFKQLNQKKFFDCEARLIDVPLPLNSTITDSKSYDMGNSKNNNHYSIFFTASMTLEDLLIFYNSEIDRLGWNKKFIIKSFRETVMLYEKPFKYLNVIIENNKNSRKQKVKCYIISK